MSAPTGSGSKLPLGIKYQVAFVSSAFLPPGLRSEWRLAVARPFATSAVSWLRITYLSVLSNKNSVSAPMERWSAACRRGEPPRGPSGQAAKTGVVTTGRPSGTGAVGIIAVACNAAQRGAEEILAPNAVECFNSVVYHFRGFRLITGETCDEAGSAVVRRDRRSLCRDPRNGAYSADTGISRGRAVPRAGSGSLIRYQAT